MKKPKVSIVITTYNRADYLSYAVESVLDQTYKDLELIIIDDGSTDNTRELIESYDDDRIIYHYQENQGQNSARNIGMSLSRGEYIAHLDSDDMFMPTKIEKQVEILDNNPDIGLVYCGTQLIDHKGITAGKHPLITYNGWVIDKLLMTNFLYNGSCAIFRKSGINNAGYFDKTFKRMTDWDFYLRYAIYYQFYGINEYLLKYRIHNETMSYDFKSYETYGVKILEKTFANKDLDSKYLKYKDRAIALRYRYMGRRYLENNLVNDARIYFKDALKLDPSLYIHSDCFILYLMSYLPISIIDQLRELRRNIKRT